MSVLLPGSEQSRDLRFENRLNVVVRHCRIGKVTPKIYRPVLPGVFKMPEMGGYVAAEQLAKRLLKAAGVK